MAFLSLGSGSIQVQRAKMVAILRVSAGGGWDGKGIWRLAPYAQLDSRARSDSLFKPRETVAGLTHCLSWLCMAVFALYSYTRGSGVSLLLFLLPWVLCGQFQRWLFFSWQTSSGCRVEKYHWVRLGSCTDSGVLSASVHSQRSQVPSPDYRWQCWLSVR